MSSSRSSGRKRKVKNYANLANQGTTVVPVYVAPTPRAKAKVKAKPKAARSRAASEGFGASGRVRAPRKKRSRPSGSRSGERKRSSGKRPPGTVRKRPDREQVNAKASTQTERFVREQISELNARNVRFRARGNDPSILLWSPINHSASASSSPRSGSRGAPPRELHGVLTYAGAPKLSTLRRFLETSGTGGAKRRGGNTPARSQIYQGQPLAPAPTAIALDRDDDDAPPEALQSTTYFNGLGLAARMFQDRSLLMVGTPSAEWRSSNGAAAAARFRIPDKTAAGDMEDDEEEEEEEMEELDLAPAIEEAMIEWRHELAQMTHRVHKVKRNAWSRTSASKRSRKKASDATRRPPCICNPTKKAWSTRNGRTPQMLWLTLRPRGDGGHGGGASAASTGSTGSTGSAAATTSAFAPEPVSRCCFACPTCLTRDDIQGIDGRCAATPAHSYVSNVMEVERAAAAKAAGILLDGTKTPRSAAHIDEIMARLLAWSGRIYTVRTTSER